MTRVAAGVLAVVVLASVATSAQGPERLFKAAMNTEMVDGNLKAAIDQYKKVAESGNRPLAAQALVRMAECYQKLGDSQSRAIYERIVREYADQRDAVTLARSKLRVTSDVAQAQLRITLESLPNSDGLPGTVTADGRYLSMTSYEDGEVHLRELRTGIDRTLTERKDFNVGMSAIAKDGSSVAYQAYAGGCEGNSQPAPALCLASLAGDGPLKSRVLVQTPEVQEIAPMDWSADGSRIAVSIRRQDRTAQIGLVNVVDGSLRILQSVDWRGPIRVVFAPDGQDLAFDLPVSDTNDDRRIVTLAVDGSRGGPVVEHSSQNIVMGWTPDGSMLLFASDRGGTMSLWAQPFSNRRPQGAPRLLRAGINGSWSAGVTRDGELYFGAVKSDRDISVMPVDFAAGRQQGPATRLLQRFVGTNSQAEWTPDGRYLAYVSQRSFNASNNVARVIGIRDTRTGEERELRPKLLYFLTLSWSPSGDALVTSGTDIKGKEGVFRIDAKSGDVSLIADSTRNGYPRWSPDGKRVFYRKGAPGQFSDFTLVEHTLASGAERSLAKGEIGVFSVSPDGQSIVAPLGGLMTASSQAVVEIRVDTGEMRELLRGGPSERIPPYVAPRWMPDGTAVLVRKRSPNEIWLVPASGAPPRRLDIDVRDWSFGGIGQFSPHPDGRRIAFLSGTSSNEVMVLKHFLPTTSPAASSIALTTRRVLDQGAPWDRISPDGRYLARVDNSTSNIQLLDLVTGRTRALTHDGNPEDPDHRYPLASTFSRDGTWLAYQWEFEKDDRSVLRAVSTEEQGPGIVRTLYDNADVSLAPTDWSPDGRWIAAVIRRKDHTAQIGVVNVADGSLRVLKTVDWSRVGGLRFSPDSLLLAYHKPAAEGRFDRDVFVIAVDGSREFVAASSPGDDTVLEWEPTGRRLLIASDRGGSMSVWSVVGSAQTQPTTFDLVKSDIGIVSSLGPTRDGTLFYNLLPTGSTTYAAQFDAATGQLSSPPVQPIQQFKGFNSGGQWSSDGKYLVYASRRDIPAPINVTRVVVPFVSTATGTVDRELLPALSYGNLGMLSPDGQKFIVRGADLKGRSGILNVDAVTGETTLVVPNETCSGVPYWAGDGKSFFCYRATEKQIVQVELSSGAVLRTFAAESQGASVSPDGQYIVYGHAGSNGLKLLALSTGATRDLIRLVPPSSGVGNSGSIEWTPDSEAVVFYGRVNGDEGMWLAPIDGRAPHKIQVAVGPILSWRFNAITGQVVFSTANSFGRLETWKMENFLPKRDGSSAKR